MEEAFQVIARNALQQEEMEGEGEYGGGEL